MPRSTVFKTGGFRSAGLMVTRGRFRDTCVLLRELAKDRAGQVTDPAVLLGAGSRYRHPDGSEWALSTHKVGKVGLPTGSLAVEDALSGPWEADWITIDGRTPAPSSASVILQIAEPVQPSRHRHPLVATAMVLLEPDLPTTWARRRSADGSPLALGTDSATGGFFDQSRYERLNEILEDESLDDVVVRATIEHGFYVDPPGAEEASVIFFGCGMGDGAYPLWQGLNDRGVVTALLCDLEVLDHLQPI